MNDPDVSPEGQALRERLIQMCHEAGLAPWDVVDAAARYEAFIKNGKATPGAGGGAAAEGQ